MGLATPATWEAVWLQGPEKVFFSSSIVTVIKRSNSSCRTICLNEWVYKNEKKFDQIFAFRIFSYLDVWERKFHFLPFVGLKKPKAFSNNLEYAVFCSSYPSYIEILNKVAFTKNLKHIIFYIHKAKINQTKFYLFLCLINFSMLRFGWCWLDFKVFWELCLVVLWYRHFGVTQRLQMRSRRKPQGCEYYSTLKGVTANYFARVVSVSISIWLHIPWDTLQHIAEYFTVYWPVWEKFRGENFWAVKGGNRYKVKAKRMT